MIDMDRLESIYLGFIGAGLALGAKLSRGERPNTWAIITAFGAGAVFGGAATDALVSAAHLEPIWAKTVSVLVGVSAMGFLINAVDGKIPLINKFVGGKPNGDDNQG